MRKAIIIIDVLVFLLISIAVPSGVEAGSITVTPTVQMPGRSVTVIGWGFGASKNIGIAFGAEIKVTGEIVNQIVTGDIRDYNFTRRPIKPGSVEIVHLNLLTGSAPLVTDNGAGTLYLGSSGNIFSNAMNYALGNFHREGVVGTNPSDYLLTASYTSYQYSLTSFGGITTDALGSFSANVSVPGVSNGNYTITVVDATGDVAGFTPLSVVPEDLPFGAIVLLSLVAVASSLYFRRRTRITR